MGRFLKHIVLPHLIQGTIHTCTGNLDTHHKTSQDYHVVLHINIAKNQRWSDCEVCERWHKLFRGNPLAQKYLRHEPLNDVELQALKAKIEQWRVNLSSISWFMRLLNEPIARQANNEDHCTGKFWEARFKSQALCDEKALAACLAYVDLNPIRAKVADKPETSDHTSAKKRIQSFKFERKQPEALTPFVGNPQEPMPEGLPFHLTDYLELLDWTGRVIRSDKRGAINSALPPILDRLDIAPNEWLLLTTRFESKFRGLVGCVDKIKQFAKKLGYQRTPGLRSCRAVFT